MTQFEIKQNKDNIKGLYSLIHFDTNQFITKFNGKILDRQAALELPTSEADSLLQIGANVYLDLKNDNSFFINHSCNSNTVVKIMSRSAFLIATRPILPQEELTFDYSITSSEMPDTWTMDCKCGSWNCRKKISGFNILADQDKEKYLKQNIVPQYVKTIIGIK